MSRRLYVTLFLVLAISFVPVIFYLGFFAFVVPTGWGYARTFHELARSDARLACVFSIYTVVYTLCFYGLARLSFRITSPAVPRRVRILCQCLILGGLFACSFLRQLTYAGFDGSGGTYNFWTAVERAIEKRSIW